MQTPDSPPELTIHEGTIAAAPGSSRRLILVGMLVASALGVFLVRTTMQPQYQPCDLAIYYTGSRAWLAGDNPYDRTLAPHHWRAAGGWAMPELEHDGGSWMPILPIPPALSVLAPLALLPARAAVWAWYCFCGMLLIAQTAALASMTGTRVWRPRAAMLLAFTLLLAPVHELFGYAQPSGPAIALIILGMWVAVAGHESSAGVLVALVAAVKPQLGVPFFVYYLLTGRWRFAAAFTLALAVLSAVAIVPMQLHGVRWLSGWLDNLSIAEARGGVNSASVENPGRFHLLNLQVILYAMFTNRWAVNAITLLITAGLAGWFAWLRSDRHSGDLLLEMGIVSILTLLPVYHRFYDAALVVVPVAWAIAHLRERRRPALAVLGLGCSFIIPARVVLRAAQLLGASLPEAWWWHLLVEPWRTWALLAGLVVLLYAYGVRATPVPVAAAVEVNQRMQAE